MSVILKQIPQSIDDEEEKKRLATELWNKVSVRPQIQVFFIGKEVSLKDSFVKKKWHMIIRRFIIAMKMEGEFHGKELIDNVYQEITVRIWGFINEKMKIEKYRMQPASKMVSMVFWKLLKESEEYLEEVKKRKTESVFRNDSYNDESEMDAIENWRDKQGIKNYSNNYLSQHIMEFEGKRYILIGGIAEHVGLSRQTLRNWGSKGLIKFTQIYYKQQIKKKTKFVRGIPEEDFISFVDRIRKIIEQKKSPIGYVSAKEASKIHNIHYSALPRWRASGKIKYVHIGNKYFYKV